MSGKLVIRTMNATNLNYQMPTYSVVVNANGHDRLWDIELEKGDGTVVLNPPSGTVVSGVVSITITGLAYIDYSSIAHWYKVQSGSSGNLYFDGESQGTVTSWTHALSEDVQIVFEAKSLCFTSNMMVKMADGTDKPIGEIRAGDVIKAINPETEEIVDDQVTLSSGRVKQIAKGYDRYTFSDGSVLEIVYRDRVYNVEDNKMKWMDQWKIGEHGFTYDKEKIELVSHEFINEEIEFYTFDCEYKNYFINGILAGKTLARYPFFNSRFISNSNN